MSIWEERSEKRTGSTVELLDEPDGHFGSVPQGLAENGFLQQVSSPPMCPIAVRRNLLHKARFETK
jgi:hypothetical protein